MGDAKKTALILAICGAAWAIIFLRSATGSGETERREPTIASSEIERYAKAQLNELQERSFADSKEYCALIYESYSGALEITRALAGSNHSCATLYVIEPGMLPLANLHTHGDYHVDYIGEVPSFQDLQVSASERVDGYVSTPGGRMWFVDWQAETARQVCGEKCLDQDPEFDDCTAFKPKESYTMQDLRFGAEGVEGSAPAC